MPTSEQLEAMIESIPALMAARREEPMPTLMFGAVAAANSEPTRCVFCGLPLNDGQCFKCFPKTRPSREAMIRQALLNVAPEEDSAGMLHCGYSVGQFLEKC